MKSHSDAVVLMMEDVMLELLPLVVEEEMEEEEGVGLVLFGVDGLRLLGNGEEGILYGLQPLQL